MTELLTDDMDIRDTKLSMHVGGNGDYYLELKETKRGEVIKIDTRIAMSGGNATPDIKHAISMLYKALNGKILEYVSLTRYNMTLDSIKDKMLEARKSDCNKKNYYIGLVLKLINGEQYLYPES